MFWSDHPRKCLFGLGVAAAIMAPQVIVTGLHDLAYIPVHAAETHFAAHPTTTAAAPASTR